jgi:hypothetical protein
MVGGIRFERMVSCSRSTRVGLTTLTAVVGDPGFEPGCTCSQSRGVAVTLVSVQEIGDPSAAQVGVGESVARTKGIEPSNTASTVRPRRQLGPCANPLHKRPA